MLISKVEKNVDIKIVKTFMSNKCLEVEGVVDVKG